MYVTTADLLARPLADRLRDLLQQNRRCPITTEERAHAQVQNFLTLGVARVFMDGPEMWLEPLDEPVHAARVQLHHRRRGEDTFRDHDALVTAPQAVMAIVRSWRDESDSFVTASLDGSPITLSELREVVREEQHRAAAAAL